MGSARGGWEGGRGRGGEGLGEGGAGKGWERECNA